MSDGLKLLGSIIDTGSVRTLRDISRDWLIDDELELYDYIRSHYRRYGQIPAIATVEDELGITVPEADETAEYYISRVNDRQLYGVVRDKFNSLKDCLRDFNMEAAKDVIAELHAATRVARTETDIRNIREAMTDVMAEYEFAHANPGVSGVPTAWHSFDYPTGGCQPGDLITWVARPGIGKTYLLLRQAQVAWQFGYSVLIVTMEMTIEQITRRLAAMQAGINPDFIRKGMLSTYAKRRLQNCIDTLGGIDRLHLFSGGLRKSTGDVELLIQEFRPDIVFIDGVYLMQPAVKKAMQKIEKVSEVFDNLKQMTLAHNVPVVVTTQFNRQAGKKGKDGSLENIAYTDAISTHSSLVLSLGEAKGSPSEAKRKRSIKFLKGREGEAGEFEINFSFAPIDFTEIPREREIVDADGNPINDSPVIATTGGNNLDYMA